MAGQARRKLLHHRGWKSLSIDEDARFGVLDDSGELGGGEADVDGHDDGPGQ
jgi:hypothetical protein